MTQATTLTLGLILCCAILFNSCGNKQQKNASPQILSKVTVVYPITETIQERLYSSGIITNSNEINLSFKNSGIVSAVYVQEGEYVSKGQLLAKIESTDLEAQLEQLSLKARETETDLKRYAKLLKDTIVTLQQYQQTQTQLQNIKSQQHAVRYNIGTMNLYAPENGIILKRNINTGEYKNASSPVLTLGNNDDHVRWAFRFSVTDQERLKLKIGQQLTIKLDADTAVSLNATIFKMMNIPNSSAGTYAIFASIQAPDNNLIYGLTGKVVIDILQPKTYTKLPLSALFELADGGASFYWIDNTNTVQKEKVSIAILQGKSVYLTDSLATNLKIVSQGGNNISQGERVTISTN